MRTIDADALVPKFKVIHVAENQIYGPASWNFTARCIQAVEDAPIVVQEQRWIPCSKELPKKDGDYCVTTHDGQIAIYLYIKGASDEYWMQYATAWMPLPEPYREEFSNNPESTKDRMDG